MLPGQKSSFRAGFRPEFNRENLKIGTLTGMRPAEGPILKLARLDPAEIWPGSPISGPEALLHNIGLAIYIPYDPINNGCRRRSVELESAKAFDAFTSESINRV